jgi:pimeloyl-ACP methyl ester carboxylesterase
MKRLAYWGSGAARSAALVPGGGGADIAMVRRGGGFLREEPATLPPFISEADIDFYAGEFARVGFRGGLNWYRNIDRNWELLAPWAGAKVTVPALYVTGDRDLVIAFRGMDQLLPALKHFVTDLRESIVLPGCGHWTAQERPAEVSDAILRFLGTLR